MSLLAAPQLQTGAPQVGTPPHPSHR